MCEVDKDRLIRAISTAKYRWRDASGTSYSMEDMPLLYLKNCLNMIRKVGQLDGKFAPYEGQRKIKEQEFERVVNMLEQKIKQQHPTLTQSVMDKMTPMDFHIRL